MTLPTTGPITMAMVAAELSISLPLSLLDSRVRALAGKPSGAVSMADLRGKSAMTVTGVNSDLTYNSDSAGGTAFASPSVTVAGGTAPYTYQWSITGSVGPALTLTQANNQTCRVARTFARFETFTSVATLSCVVTSANGAQRTVTGVTGQVNVESNV